MRSSATGGVLAAIVVFVVGCGAGTPRINQAGESRTDGGRGADQSRTLVMTTRAEPDTIAAKEVMSVTGLSFDATPRIFNAGLALLDAREAPLPYLVEAHPQLSTDTWRVFADGRMETTYRLRPNLRWHDGAALSAHDFAFAWRVYSNPELGQAATPPIGQMEDVVAVDDRTVVIRWRSSYPNADALEADDFQPLPRHILGDAYQPEQIENFGRLLFWTTEYVGLGPYRLDRWQPGAFLEAVAFDGHAWGRPKIDRVRILFISDFNTVLANMLAGEAHITVDDSIRFQQGAILRREWAPRNAGFVLTTPDQWRRSEPQHRPEFANPRAILDVRMRKALAHTIDKQALNEGMFEGEAILADTFVAPNVPFYAELDRVITKYPYDPRRAEQLMAEAGFTRGADGIYAHPTEGRFSGELKVNASDQSVREMAIIASGWREAGFQFREVPVPQAQSRLGEVRGSFPTLYTGGGGVASTVIEGSAGSFISSRIATPENRWVGGNRSGWSNTEYDRLFDAYNSTLDRSQRNQHMIRMAQLFTEDAAALSLFFNPGIVAHVAALHGPMPFAPAADVAWNIHEWEWR